MSVDIQVPVLYLKLKGEVTLIATDPRTGRVVKRLTQRNLIVNNGLYLIGDMLIDASAAYDSGLTYCAIGTGTNAAAAGNTTLQTESARKQITYRGRTTNSLDIRTFFTAAESSYNLKETGLFGSTTATGAADSGVLFSRSLLSAGGFDNSSGNYDITIAWTITLAAA